LQGSLFDHNQWLGGIDGVYYCDPTNPSDGTPVQCEFTFFSQDQVDTTSGQSWIFKKGLASQRNGRD
jgi:hypothetical protein